MYFIFMLDSKSLIKWKRQILKKTWLSLQVTLYPIYKPNGLSLSYQIILVIILLLSHTHALIESRYYKTQY